MKVLYVEDDSLLRELYNLKLSKAGYLVDTAVNGEDGLAKAKSFLPDLILLDILMPKLDGLGMLKLLRQDPATQHIPVILLTNSPSLPNARECEALGITNVFLKANVTPAQLVSYLQTFFSKQSS